MKIICNGGEQEIRPGMTLVEFIREMKLNPDTVVAECDGVIIRREKYDELVLSAACRLELIRFVGGG
jgi:thiamine biosynthesis protein ThiS